MDSLNTPSIKAAEVPDPQSDSVLLLDVREDDEWQQGRAPGAVHIPMGDVPARVDELDLDATLYVVCRQGGRSAAVTEYLRSIGIEATNVKDGMVGWQKSGRPLVGDTAGPKVY